MAAPDSTNLLPGMISLLLSALVGAIFGWLAPFIKSVTIDRWNEEHATTRTQREIIRNYLAPLVDVSEKIVWRFNEIFVIGRHQWLKTETLPLEYNQYKRTSTLYRLACLLGWIRAIQIELNALPRGRAGFSEPILTAMSGVQSALADGPDVEIHRLRRLCSVWELDYSHLTEAETRRLATQLEVDLYCLAGTRLKHDDAPLTNLAPKEKATVCMELSQRLCSALGKNGPSESFVAETCARAIESVSYRESLLYRDWQDAIGDAMLLQDQGSVRRFKTIGYEQFGELLKSDRQWFRVMSRMLDDIDFGHPDPSDFRRVQLIKLRDAVARLFLAIGTAEEHLIDPGTAKAARGLLQESP